MTVTYLRSPSTTHDEVTAVAALALAYREISAHRYEGLRGVFDEFREAGERFLPVSALSLRLIIEMGPADFQAIKIVSRLDAIEDEGIWLPLLAIWTSIFGAFPRLRPQLEPMLHALDCDPRPFIQDVAVATPAATRWDQVEDAMAYIKQIGGMRAAADVFPVAGEAMRYKLDFLHNQVTALLLELEELENS